MDFELNIYRAPSESASRKLDNLVARQEMPYGYESSPPPADTRDYDQVRLESSKQYPKRNGRSR